MALDFCWVPCCSRIVLPQRSPVCVLAPSGTRSSTRWYSVGSVMMVCSDVLRWQCIGFVCLENYSATHYSATHYSAKTTERLHGLAGVDGRRRRGGDGVAIITDPLCGTGFLRGAVLLENCSVSSALLARMIRVSLAWLFWHAEALRRWRSNND